MRPSRWILLWLVVLLAIGASWLWWARPRKVDMATYAPADSMLYLEANDPLAIVAAIENTDAWKSIDQLNGTSFMPRTRWLQRFIAQTGIGTIESVIVARAQVAVVVTELGTLEEGDTLKIKPELAFLIETHTAESRIRPWFDQTLKALAQRTYDHPTSRRITKSGIELVEWSAPEGSRQIVGTVIGSRVIVGNSERAVQNCVEVALRTRPSLKDDPELDRMRFQLAKEDQLTFGYVPAKNSARLLAVGLPLLLGRTPGDNEFQRLVTKGAENIIGTLGWSCKRRLSGIEDRYLIKLQPAVVAHLKPHFELSNKASQLQRSVTNDIHSATSYNFVDPEATWQSLKAAVSSQADALSTIVFASLLKSSLMSYGINDPDAFLDCVDGELLTLRFDENAERSILVGSVRDSAKLRNFVLDKLRLSPHGGTVDHTEVFEDATGEFAAIFSGDLIIIGTSADVRNYVSGRQANKELDSDKLKRIFFFHGRSTAANVVTYTDDTNRVRRFIFSVLALKGSSAALSEATTEAVAHLPFSLTETTLSDRGIERVTKSPLGQFSTILPLLIPEQAVSESAGSKSEK